MGSGFPAWSAAVPAPVAEAGHLPQSYCRSRAGAGGSMSSDADLAPLIEPVARRLLGEPNLRLSTRTELRFGTHGSVAVVIAGPKRGTWYDHEAGEGGGVLDLVRIRKQFANGEEL